MLKEKAEVLERGDGALRSERLSMERPTVIRLVTYVRIPRDAHRRKITRKAVLARDSWTCQYCGSRKPGLTVDHVIPRSRGGKSVWENIVASCASCNRRKGNRLPREIKMHPRSRPRRRRPTVFIRIASPTIPLAWQQYLPRPPSDRRNDESRPKAASRQVRWNERGNAAGWDIPDLPCSPVPGLDSAGRPKQCGA